MSFEIPVPPPEVAEILQDPRTQNMRLETAGMSGERRMLMPEQPPTEGESNYLLLSPSLNESTPHTVTWVDRPKGTGGLGGKGLDFITERPRINEDRRRPAQLRDAWHYNTWLVASARFAEIVQRFEPGFTATREIDWVFSDGKKLEGYVFLDICRLIYAYDYSRSEVLVEAGTKARYVTGLGARRALKTSIDQSIHAFRDTYLREDFFFSREMSRALAAAGIREVAFCDPATMKPVDF